MALYSIRIFKSWGGRVPDRRWVNNYEVEAGELGLSDLDAVANGIVAAEKTIHRANVYFLSATVSTWEPDGTPYNPLSFRTLELAGQGSIASVAGAGLDSNVAFLVGFQCTTGRNGRRFYRGVLEEADVETGNDGRFTLSAASLLKEGGSSFTAFQTAIGPYLAGGANATKIVLAGGSGVGVERVVQSVKSVGVVINRRNHRYFDRV